MTKPSAVAIDRDIVIEAFHRWAAKDPEYRSSYADLSERALVIAVDALEEIIELRTSAFDDWYLRNGYRYGSLREVERRMARGVARAFIGALQQGKVPL